MSFDVTLYPSSAPGHRTFCFVDEEATLVVYSGPDCLSIVAPSDPAEWPGFGRFLGDLGRAAAELAEWFGRPNSSQGAASRVTVADREV
ncbi:hypothetical protein [Saccharomonospora piscinae]|uniref:hypothetical protein n=1 Tax=Saccharomonospora piscinae TaxID=687388 RepID=UPI000465C226|nr:hypothetical protein [Saccharomonospora piscinae]